MREDKIMHTMLVHGLETARKLAHEWIARDPTVRAVISATPETIQHYRLEEVHYGTSRDSCVFCKPVPDQTYTLTIYAPGSKYHR